MAFAKLDHRADGGMGAVTALVLLDGDAEAGLSGTTFATPARNPIFHHPPQLDQKVAYVRVADRPFLVEAFDVQRVGTVCVFAVSRLSGHIIPDAADFAARTLPEPAGLTGSPPPSQPNRPRRNAYHGRGDLVVHPGPSALRAQIDCLVLSDRPGSAHASARRK